MQVNKNARNARVSKEKEKLVENKEGFLVYEDNIFRKFLLQSISLNVSRSRTYFKDTEILDEYIKTLKNVDDRELMIKSMSYLTEKFGRKLSPAVIAGYLISEFKKGNSEGNDILPEYILKNFNDRPDKIANTLAIYSNLYNGEKTIKDVPNKYKRVFGELLSNYKDITLKKFKMRRRDIKLADMIKLFHPKPKNEKHANLFKSIIENTVDSKIKETEHITATLSSTNLTKEEKNEVLKNNLKDIPIQALIRNLVKFNDFDEKDKNIIKKRLNEIMRDRNFKYLNINELFIDPNLLDADLIDILNNVIYEFLKEYENSFADEKYSIVQDLSGSMAPGWHNKDCGIKNSAKFLSCILPLIKEYDFTAFSNQYITYTKENDYWGIYSLVRRFRKRPIELYDELFKLLGKMIKSSPFGGGTSLIGTINDLDYKNFIILSDEITWNEKDKYDAIKFKFFTERNDKTFFMYNTNYTDGKVVSDSTNLIRITGLSNELFTFFSLYGGNINNVIKHIKENY